MSQRSALWSALALTAVFVLLFGVVLLRPALGDSADAEEQVRTIVVEDAGNADGAGAPVDVGATSDDDDDWYEDDEHSDEHERDEHEHEDGDDD